MPESMAICTKDFTFLNLVSNPLKSYGAPETSYSEQLILAFFVMEIKNSRISNSAVTAPLFLFVFVKPFKILPDKLLFGHAITVSTLTPTVDLE
jgi:hypothetical protein